MADGTTIRLSKELVDTIQARANVTGYDDVDSYVEYVLSEVVHQLDNIDASETIDESEVKDRLETLGYLE